MLLILADVSIFRTEDEEEVDPEGYFIYTKLGILLLRTEPWHCTRSISISWDFCLYWKAIGWIDYVYRY